MHFASANQSEWVRFARFPARPLVKPCCAVSQIAHHVRVGIPARAERGGESLRLIRALASERDDEWFDGACYLNMEALREQSKIQLPLAA